MPNMCSLGQVTSCINSIVLAEDEDEIEDTDFMIKIIIDLIDQIDEVPKKGAFPRTPEFDLYVSHYHISNTAYDMLPVFGKVIALDIDLSLKQAFQILYEQLCHGSTLSDEQFETHTKQHGETENYSKVDARTSLDEFNITQRLDMIKCRLFEGSDAQEVRALVLDCC